MMASCKSVTINVEPKVTGSTAKLCAAALELYLNQNPELELKVNTLDDGTVMLKFEERKEPDPRAYDSTKCGGLGSYKCDMCDMRCPYR